jgi:hypothetical protein
MSAPPLGRARAPRAASGGRQRRIEQHVEPRVIQSRRAQERRQELALRFVGFESKGRGGGAEVGARFLEGPQRFLEALEVGRGDLAQAGSRGEVVAPPHVAGGVARGQQPQRAWTLEGGEAVAHPLEEALRGPIVAPELVDVFEDAERPRALLKAASRSGRTGAERAG